jgi:anaerobic selenocysteine-containing dehydrogenase/Fe-S-cluster-containing dehydrogenase component
MHDDISRRSFLKIASLASSALALDACDPQRGTKLIPYLVPEQNVVPGVPAFYRTACSECNAGCSTVARVREGRVIKLEGNPDNPINAGTLCARGQAALQGLYNPDRLPEPRYRAAKRPLTPITWDEAISVLASHCKQAVVKGANRIALLSLYRGPSYHDVIANVLQSFNSTHIFYYEPLAESAALQASKACFNRPDLPNYRIDQAEVLISFGADFLETWRSPIEFSRQYAEFRAPKKNHAAQHLIGLAYYAGPRMGLTAAKTDYYYQCRLGTEAAVALATLRALKDQGLIKAPIDAKSLDAFLEPFAPQKMEPLTGVAAKYIQRMAGDFGRASSALAIAGTDDVATHIAAFVMNAATGNLNKTVVFPQTPHPPRATGQLGVKPLIEAMQADGIDVLIIAGGNPAFTMSSEMKFAAAISHVPLVVWCGGVPNETAELAHLQLPIHHPLEDWSDDEARPGVHTLGQPAMQPVFYSASLGDILLEVAHRAGYKPRWPDLRAAVEQRWQGLHEQHGGQSAQEFWVSVRRKGGLFVESPNATVQLNQAVLRSPIKLSPPSTQLTLFAYPHIFFYDGRGADKPWLQENPDPIEQIVWDSWVQIHPDNAKRLGIRNNDLIEISSADGTISLPAKIDRGIHPESVAVPIGQGHTAYGRYARDRGANPWPLLPPERFIVPVTLRPTGRKYELISPLFIADMMHRPIVEKISLEDVKKGIKPPPEEPPPPEPYELWPVRHYKEHHWGMTIDVNACTGCGACVTACYAENNLSVVGKHGVQMGRIMSWLRLERYFPKELDAPQIYIMPMLCQQCDNAPCEPVCPVYASYHTEEGLNGQIYNRCVGTRYCENNCPYKVRRFNWFRPVFDEPLQLQLNPDVTVRGVGVMEKCTFCVQRIRKAEITAQVENRPLNEGDIIPACAETCPSHAITFGDIKDKNSAMMRRRRDNSIRTYRALEDLNTRPSIVYLRTIYRNREV